MKWKKKENSKQTEAMMAWMERNFINKQLWLLLVFVYFFFVTAKEANWTKI